MNLRLECTRYADLSIMERYWYMADSNVCLDRYLRPARKVFNFGKKGHRGQGLVNKDGVVKLLPSRFAKQSITMADVWAWALSY